MSEHPLPECPAILIDTKRCTGCERCVRACKLENGLGPDRPWRGQGAVDGLSATRFSTILRLPNAEGPKDHFVRQQCRHCLEPACVSACLVGAMEKTLWGPVIYHPEKCMGCRYCMAACPYGIPRYDWDRAVPEVRKCTLCYPRIIQGKPPACVEACPEGALEYGDRAKLLARAESRLEANPDYVQEVFGKYEVGGTSVLYISDVRWDLAAWVRTWQPDVDARDLPDPTKSLPERTWASLKKVPPVIVGMAGLMGGLHWIIGRRMKLAAQETSAPAPDETQDDDPTNTTQGDKDDHD